MSIQPLLNNPYDIMNMATVFNLLRPHVIYGVPGLTQNNAPTTLQSLFQNQKLFALFHFLQPARVFLSHCNDQLYSISFRHISFYVLNRFLFSSPSNYHSMFCFT